MTQIQKSRIQEIQFKWLMWFPEKLKICGIFVEELVNKWNERCGGFIEDRPIRFTLLDVCFALGLRIIGQKVGLNDDPESSTKKCLMG
jgi:hypothetical protein